MIDNNENSKVLNQKQISSFLEILKVLNRHYSYIGPNEPQTETALFRKKIEAVNPSELQVQLLRVDSYQFLIKATFNNEAKKWYHIDGIQQERDCASTPENHPVYSITCLTDIYLNKI
jgi:hypothetical protein